MHRNMSSRAAQQGLSLIELMIALIVGLLIIGATLMVFSGNQQTARVTESQSRIQESTRTAFELMARELREAGGNACESELPVINVLNAGDALQQALNNAEAGLIGYAANTAALGLATGTAAGNRIAGTEAIEIKSAVVASVGIAGHAPDTARFTSAVAAHGFVPGDIAVACDFNHATVFQVSAVSGASIDHKIDVDGIVPGNRVICMAIDGSCAATPTKKTYTYGCRHGELPCTGTEWPAQLAKLRVTRWYVGANPRGGRSLYQSVVATVGGTPTLVNQEVVEGVQSLQFEYLVNGSASYVGAAAMVAANWPAVKAVRVRVQVQGEERVGTNGQALTQTMVHTVAIRNRNL